MQKADDQLTLKFVCWEFENLRWGRWQVGEKKGGKKPGHVLPAHDNNLVHDPATASIASGCPWSECNQYNTP